MSPATGTDIRLEELRLPATATRDDPDWPAFVEMIGIRNQVVADAIGTDRLAWTPESILPQFQDHTWSPSRSFVLRVDGIAVGRGSLGWSTEGGSPLAFPTVEVLPAYRRASYGSMLADHIEKLAAEMDRTLLRTWVGHPERGNGERIESPAGAGSIPADDPGVLFLLRREYQLGQVGRTSVLDLPVDPDVLSRLRTTAEAASADYRLVTWIGSAPDDRVDDLCLLRTRMSTDAPNGAMLIEEETWTPERLRKRERQVEDGGQTILTAAAEHRATGRLVGYTNLYVPSDFAQPVDQGTTLVLSEHRGHRLGVLIKVANIEQLRQFGPDATMIVTGNAEENRYMLSTNEALGFRPLLAEGVWEKHLES
ncbi:MAG TPA: GNAT family N-acetyltransferase [Thermomicrobiales bacterium]|jgi:GNAT superfamily N-acetyltransferase|nr:GNAT family N-acetyltransferase [Thermomicrobiales bacterium]